MRKSFANLAVLAVAGLGFLPFSRHSAQRVHVVENQQQYENQGAHKTPKQANILRPAGIYAVKLIAGGSSPAYSYSNSFPAAKSSYKQNLRKAGKYKSCKRK
jgi:hypothetical protein